MTNEQAITELIAEVKIITQALQEMHNYMTIVDKRVTTLEAKHGHWVDTGHGCKCSVCGTPYRWNETDTMKFCKECGARMDGEEDD